MRFVVVAVLTASCGNVTTAMPDGGSTDAATPDAGTVDAATDAPASGPCVLDQSRLDECTL